MSNLTTLSGDPLSPLTFGTMQFGGSADAHDSLAMFDVARSAGINHFDTAVGYTEGRSETLLGQFVADDRNRIFVASKVGYSGGAGAANINTQFDRVRQQSGLDTIDLLYMHRFDDNTPLEDTFAALAALQDKGQVRHLGVSNYAAWQVMKAQVAAQRFGTRIDVIQPMYSLVKRQAEVEMLPMAHDQDILVCPYSPLGGGLLTGKYAKGATGRLTEDDGYAIRYGLDWMHQTARHLSDLAATYQVHPATLAAAWAAHHPTQPRPIISARSVDQLKPSLAALDFNMTPELRDEISALSHAPPPATDRIEEA